MGPGSPVRCAEIFERLWRVLAQSTQMRSCTRRSTRPHRGAIGIFGAFWIFRPSARSRLAPCNALREMRGEDLRRGVDGRYRLFSLNTQRRRVRAASRSCRRRRQGRAAAPFGHGGKRRSVLRPLQRVRGRKSPNCAGASLGRSNAVAMRAAVLLLSVFCQRGAGLPGSRHASRWKRLWRPAQSTRQKAGGSRCSSPSR